jgi:hypothetical protein
MIIMKKAIWLAFVISLYHITQAQTVSFNFSAASQTVPGWINVAGDPTTAVRSATDGTISISSVGMTNWASPNNAASYDGGGAPGGTFFPAAVMANHWFQYGNGVAAYNALIPQLQLSGLNPDSVYTLKMTGSFTVSVPGSFELNPIRYTVTGIRVYGNIDINGDFNTASGATFVNISPDASGHIKIYVNTAGSSNVASICGLQVIRGRTGVLAPVVTINSPANNDILVEDGNVTINATATETGGSIARVEFYADSTLLGSDSTAPYALTWINPNEGKYTIRARAIDAAGNDNSAVINVSVESLTSFWSMTGNINMNADSNFVGNVDSVRLAFRTKNIERLSILPTGNIGIGTKTPSAQFHTTGTVRLAGLTSDSTKSRVLVSDTSGNLFYRSTSSLGSASGWATGGNAGTNPASNFIGTTDAQRLIFKTNGVENMTILANGAVGIGTSGQVASDAKLFVKGFIYAQKVRVTQQNWADYVFKKDYHLPSLAEVEQYIAHYQHLPGVISAGEVSRKGLDLGDNQAVLLQKIEELTLYLIGQDKKSAEQDNKLQDRDQQLEEMKKTLKLQQEKIDRLEKLLLQVIPDGKPSTN